MAWVLVGCAIAIGSAMVIGSVANYFATTKAAAETAEAQKETATRNKEAAIESANAAANATIKSAQEDSKARMHESDTALKQEKEYIKQNQWEYTHSADNYEAYRKSLNAIDSMDLTYSSAGNWGSGKDSPYDHGEDDTVNI